ncbi:hypothetical protein FC44_GL001481 [Lactobacillus intestinalis DSM 6629]|uniref:Uncharacterized protein n=1 Tax=Lactobacillus intestinalis DSM 6629 TaxID=1423761 RepID=A0ABR5PQN3_9LACO|nr:hypothetical protein FC44_GL001481 [Lactobacillus intestinalis DSM 6629]
MWIAVCIYIANDFSVWCNNVAICIYCFAVRANIVGPPIYAGCVWCNIVVPVAVLAMWSNIIVVVWRWFWCSWFWLIVFLLWSSWLLWLFWSAWFFRSLWCFRFLWCFLLSVNYLCILSWIYWSYTIFTWSVAWNIWNWFIRNYLSWISWIILILWLICTWNWISRWIYWNDLTDLMVNNCYVCVRVLWSYCLTTGSLNFCNIAINYWNVDRAKCITRFTIGELVSLNIWITKWCIAIITINEDNCLLTSYSNRSWLRSWSWGYILVVNYWSVLCRINWSNSILTWSVTWNIWNWFIWSYLSWISWIILILWLICTWNWISRWIYWNDLADLMVNN